MGSTPRCSASTVSLIASTPDNSPVTRRAVPSEAPRHWKNCHVRPRRTGRDLGRRSHPTYPPIGTSRDSPRVQQSLKGLKRTTLISTAPIHSSQSCSVEADPGDHFGVASFLEPDHPFGVLPVHGLVEDLPGNRADRIGRRGSGPLDAAGQPQRPSARRVARRGRSGIPRVPAAVPRRPTHRPRRDNRPLRATDGDAAMRWPGSDAVSGHERVRSAHALKGS